MINIFKYFDKHAVSDWIHVSPEGRLSGDGIAVLRFPECLLDGLLAAAPGPLACPSRGARSPSPS